MQHRFGDCASRLRLPNAQHHCILGPALRAEITCSFRVTRRTVGQVWPFSSGRRTTADEAAPKGTPMSAIPFLKSHLGLNAVDRFVRLPLRLIPKSWELSVLSGPNVGYKWTVGSGVHGCWLGTYERDQILHLKTLIRSGITVFDAGAHAGYYSLAASRMVGPSGKVLAFEPNPNNLRNLRRHIAVNSIRNVEIIDAAVSSTVSVVLRPRL
jgi:hypothetical protein